MKYHEDIMKEWRKIFRSGHTEEISERFSAAGRFSWGKKMDEMRLSIKALGELFKDEEGYRNVANELWAQLPEKGALIREACRANEDLAHYLGTTFCDVDKNALALKEGFSGIFPTPLSSRTCPEYNPAIAPETRLGLAYLALRQNITEVDFAPPAELSVICAEMGLTELMKKYKSMTGYVSGKMLLEAAVLGNQKETLLHLLEASEIFFIRESLELSLEMGRMELLEVTAQMGGVNAYALKKAWNEENLLALEVMLPFAKDSDIQATEKALSKTGAATFKETVETLKTKKYLEEKLKHTGFGAIKNKKL